MRSNRRAEGSLSLGGTNTDAFACGGGSRGSHGASHGASRAAPNRGAFSSFSSSNPTPRSSRAVILSALRCDTGSPRASHGSFDDKNPEPSGLEPSLVLGLFSQRLCSAPKPAMRSAALADEGRRTTLIAPRRRDDALPTAVLRALPTSRAHPRSRSSRRPRAARAVRCGVASERFGVSGAFFACFPSRSSFAFGDRGRKEKGSRNRDADAQETTPRLRRRCSRWEGACALAPFPNRRSSCRTRAEGPFGLERCPPLRHPPEERNER